MFAYDDDEEDEDLKVKDDDGLEPPPNYEPSFYSPQPSESGDKSEESQSSGGESYIRVSHSSHSSVDDPTPSENIHPPFS